MVSDVPLLYKLIYLQSYTIHKSPAVIRRLDIWKRNFKTSPNVWVDALLKWRYMFGWNISLHAGIQERILLKIVVHHGIL